MNLMPLTDTASGTEVILSESTVAKTAANLPAVSALAGEQLPSSNGDDSRKVNKRSKKDRQKANTDPGKPNIDRSTPVPPTATVLVGSASTIVEGSHTTITDNSNNTDSSSSQLLASSSATVVKDSAPRDLPVVNPKTVVQARAVIQSSATGNESLS
jgi:hypothetical protein